MSKPVLSEAVVARIGPEERAFPAVFRKNRRIRFADTDPAGVAYFPTILSYFHAVFEDFFDEGLGVPYREVLEDHGIGFPAVRVEVDYKRPLRFGDDVEIRLYIDDVGRSSILTRYEVVALPDEQPAVICTMVVATVKLDGFEAIPVPDELRRRFAARVQA